MRIVNKQKVITVEERFTHEHVSGVGKDAKFNNSSTGWWVVTTDFIGIWVGHEQPNIKRGSIVTVAVEYDDLG